MQVRIKCFKGFTLLELAMVLFIVSLLLIGLLRPLSIGIDQEHRKKTEVLLNEIKDALIGYAVINGRLPCPDCPDSETGECSEGNPNDGMGSNDMMTGTVGSQVCRTIVGNLPWVELQVPQFDNWGNHFTYRVSSVFSDETGADINNDGYVDCDSRYTAKQGVYFAICTVGDIDIRSTYNKPYSGTPDIASGLAAVIVSHGANFLDSIQHNQEVENYGRNPVNPGTGDTILNPYDASDYDPNVFIYKDYEQVDGTAIYDDLMIWISPNILINRMISAGKLP